MNKYLVKVAAKERLRPHQYEALNKLDTNGGVILHHSTGSGKSISFLMAAKKALDSDKSKRALIVAPASLVSNVDKELDKHGIKLDRSRLDVYSYEKAVNMADELGKNKYSIAISDEAQKLRNADTKRTKTLSEIMKGADKRLLATATANYNSAADIAPLINIAAGKEVLPENRKEFENKYLAKVYKQQGFMDKILRKPKEEKVVLKNTKQLHDLFEKHVHYYDSAEDPEAQAKFPAKTREIVDVEMSPEQKRMYSFVEGKVPFMLRMKIRHNLPMDKKEKAQLNSFSTGVRQASNSIRHLNKDPESVDYTPKIRKAVENLVKAHNKDPNFRGLVYSNFLDAGVNEYSKLLKEKGISHHVYTGGLTAKEKDAMVKDYNEGRRKALVISSSGAEGLDLKGTKLVQILEDHFNPSKIKQVEGRAARYESHEHLKPEERTVHIQKYRSVLPKPMFGKAPYSIDKYLSENSDDKQEVFDQIKAVMKKAN